MKWIVGGTYMALGVGTVEVEADTEEEAMEKVLAMDPAFLDIDDEGIHTFEGFSPESAEESD